MSHSPQPAACSDSWYQVVPSFHKSQVSGGFRGLGFWVQLWVWDPVDSWAAVKGMYEILQRKVSEPHSKYTIMNLGSNNYCVWMITCRNEDLCTWYVPQRFSPRLRFQSWRGTSWVWSEGNDPGPRVRLTGGRVCTRCGRAPHPSLALWWLSPPSYMLSVGRHWIRAATELPYV